MTARSGGRYDMRGGKPVLVERTGYKPEAEAKTADTSTASKSSGKAASKKEGSSDGSAK